MKKAISLSDLLPEIPEFTLRGLGLDLPKEEKKEHTFKVRPPTLADQAWLGRTYTGDKLSILLENQDWEEICRIVYHQLSDDDRRFFPMVNAKIINEEGEELQKKMSGPEHLYLSIGGPQEGLAMLGALIKALGISNPLVEEVVKKNFLKMDQESPPPQPTGHSSSTPSSRNMAGQKKKSRT